MSILPVVKWAGGKRQLLNELKALMPKTDSIIEPFCGGAALTLDLLPESAWLNDLNSELINFYSVIRDDVEGLISRLKQLEGSSAQYYKLRSMDRDMEAYATVPSLEKAARFTYINHMSYNGVWRVNKYGQCNIAYGKQDDRDFILEDRLRALHTYLNSPHVKISCYDFEEVIHAADEGDFLYVDPPYDKLDHGSFVSYTPDGFSREDHARLYECLKQADKRGVRFLLSAAPTDYMHQLWSRYTVTGVRALRVVNSDGDNRGTVRELLVCNY